MQVLKRLQLEKGRSGGKGSKDVIDSPTSREVSSSILVVNLAPPLVDKKHKRKERSKMHSSSKRSSKGS